MSHHPTAQRFLATVTAIRDEPPIDDVITENAKARETDVLKINFGDKADTAKRYLMAACEQPAPRVQSIYDRLQLYPQQGSKLTRKLEQVGAIRTHTIATGRRGGNMKVPEITRLGLEQLSLEPPPRIVGGEFLSNLTAHALKKDRSGNGYRVAFEQELGSRRLDVTSYPKNGSLPIIYTQIGVSHTQREADSLASLVSAPAVHTGDLEFIGIDNRFNSKVVKLLKNHDANVDWAKRIQFRLVGEVLNAVYGME